MAERQQITNHRVTGKIADWKGAFGWIDLSTPISHPDALKHRGKVYLNVKDVEEEIEGIGALVSFFVYTDGSGLGAMNVKPASSVTSVVKTVAKPVVVQAPPKSVFTQAAAKGASKGASPPGMQRTVVSHQLQNGEVSTVKGAFGWIKPSQPIQHPLFKGSIYVQQTDMIGGVVLTEGQQVAFQLYSDGKGLGAQQVRVVPSGPPAAKAQAAPPSQLAAYGIEKKDLPQPGPRERIGDVQVIGEIVEWKGQFGWIQLAEEVDHPDASKRRGRVYVAIKDCKERKNFVPGDIVQFFLYTDGTGLGAEECSSF